MNTLNHVPMLSFVAWTKHFCFNGTVFCSSLNGNGVRIPLSKQFMRWSHIICCTSAVSNPVRTYKPQSILFAHWIYVDVMCSSTSSSSLVFKALEIPSVEIPTVMCKTYLPTTLTSIPHSHPYSSLASTLPNVTCVFNFWVHLVIAFSPLYAPSRKLCPSTSSHTVMFSWLVSHHHNLFSVYHLRPHTTTVCWMCTILPLVLLLFFLLSFPCSLWTS